MGSRSIRYECLCPGQQGFQVPPEHHCYVFSKYGWLVSLKDKKGSTVRDVFQRVFKERVPEKLWTDKGTKFYNKEVKQLLQKHGVSLYSTQNEEKLSIVERWNRTMKERMFKYFSVNTTRSYLPVLDGLVRQYNTAKHSSIKMTPTASSQKKHETKVYWNLYGDIPPMQSPRFRVGDKLPITQKKGTSEKGYTPHQPIASRATMVSMSSGPFTSAQEYRPRHLLHREGHPVSQPGWGKRG